MTTEGKEMRLIVRGWKNGVLAFAEAHMFNGHFNALGEDIQTMADRQIAQVASAPLHLIEIEFLDEPDREKRFMRLGTDKDRMVDPQPVDLVWRLRAVREVSDRPDGVPESQEPKPSVN